MTFSKIVTCFILITASSVYSSVIAPAIAPPVVPAIVPAVRYAQVAPPNISPFAASVSTFTKGLNIYASPFAAGVLPSPAFAPRTILPAPLPNFAPAVPSSLLPAPFAPVLPPPLVPAPIARSIHAVAPGFIPGIAPQVLPAAAPAIIPGIAPPLPFLR